LTAEVPQASRGKLQACIKAGNVIVNGKQELKTSFTVRPGDHVQCVLLDAPVMQAIPEVSSLHQCCNKFVYRRFYVQTTYLGSATTFDHQCAVKRMPDYHRGRKTCKQQHMLLPVALQAINDIALHGRCHSIAYNNSSITPVICFHVTHQHLA